MPGIVSSAMTLMRLGPVLSKTKEADSSDFPQFKFMMASVGDLIAVFMSGKYDFIL